ncbi:MAG: endonuclease/exonuclease/phosphatase family protein [Pseudomonadota bacterium]
MLRLATYNVHYIILERDTGAWSVGDWDRRKGPLDAAFKAVNADVIAFQEMESFARGNNRVNLTLDWLLENNPDYRAAAVGDPATFPSTQPILYRPDRVEMLDQGWFFFSETPDVIYSRTFNGSFPAFASWAEFRDPNAGAAFKIVNIHTDFASRSNRIQSLELVASRVAPWTAQGETVFVVGDFNGRLGDQVVEILADEGFDFAPVKGATFHFNRGINLFGAIDHIAVNGDATRVGEPVVLRQKFQGEWPTDHYPVIVDYRLGANG